jgi:hypothetical protein
MGGASRGQSVVTLEPSKDNTIYEVPSNASGGASPWFFSGVNEDGNARRALLAFDIAGSIPAGSDIESVTLELHVSKTQLPLVDFSLHRMLGDWGETTTGPAGRGGGAGAIAEPGDATWVQAFAGDMATDWGTRGGDFVSTASATTSAGLNRTLPQWSSESHQALVDDVQAWLDAPDQNWGWILRGDEGRTPSTIRYDSKESSVPSNRPQLEIEYVAEPSGGALAIASLAILGTIAGRARRRQPEKYFV